MKKAIVAILIFAALCAVLAGCTQRQSARVSHNISLEADNFNVIRRLTVLNARTDKPMFELIGAFSFKLETNRIIVTVETGPNEYKKHSVGLNDWTLWVIEDISGSDVNKYRYEVNFLPETIIPIEIVSKD